MATYEHTLAGHEQNTSAATEGGAPGSVGQHGELPARFAAATKMLTDTASAESVVATVGRALLFLTEAEHAAIFLRSPTGLVTCPWSYNLSSAYVDELVTPKDANPWMHILRYPEISCMDLPKTKRQTSATPWFLPDVLDLSSDHERLINRITREGLRSMCTWPITRAGRVIAACVYCYDSPHLYSQDEQGVMAAFASQAAAALQEPRAPTDSQGAFGVKTMSSVPKLQIVDAARSLVADMHRATGDEQARGEIEAARAQRQLEAEQARLTADRTSLDADSRRVAQAQAALAAETERLAEARQDLTLEADELAAARGKWETERAQLVKTPARLAATEGQLVRVDVAAVETEQARPAARRSESDAAWPSRRGRATLVASTVIAALATAILGIGLEGHRPAVSTTVYKPAAQVLVTAVQKRPLPTPHRVIVAGVVPRVAKAVVPHRTSPILPPPKATYVVVVGTFESSSAAEEMMHLAQSKGYVVHVVLHGAVSKVMTAPMRTRTQAEGVARGLEAVGLQAQVTLRQ